MPNDLDTTPDWPVAPGSDHYWYKSILATNTFSRNTYTQTEQPAKWGAKIRGLVTGDRQILPFGWLVPTVTAKRGLDVNKWGGFGKFDGAQARDPSDRYTFPPNHARRSVPNASAEAHDPSCKPITDLTTVNVAAFFFHTTYTVLAESSLPLILPPRNLGPSFLIVVPLKAPIFAIRRRHWSVLVTPIATLLGSVAFFLSSTLAYAGV